MSTTPPTFAARLRTLRAAAGLTQQQLAAVAGLHRVSIARLETGERDPSWPTIQALARALCVSLQELLVAPAAGKKS